jgi:hypothetical protein
MKKKIQGVKKDMVRAEVRNLVHGPSYMTFEDAVADFPSIRELAIVSEHNTFHIGEFAILRQIMGTWPARR